jgi:hypothetical protein
MAHAKNNLVQSAKINVISVLKLKKSTYFRSFKACICIGTQEQNKSYDWYDVYHGRAETIT